MRFIIVFEYTNLTPLLLDFKNEEEALEYYEFAVSNLRVTLYESSGNGQYTELKTKNMLNEEKE